MTMRGRQVRDWLVWMSMLVVATAAMLPLRSRLAETHVTLAYLLIVLYAGARAGKAIALTTAGIAFLLFNWFFLPPYGTLVLANPLHWFVLLAFLVVSVVATQLFERSKNEAVLRETSRAKDAVIASLAHDLRTPLTTIKAVAHDMSASGDERAMTIEEEADRLHTLVGDLLDLSKLNEGRTQLNVEPNEAEDLLGAALKQLSAAANGRDIRVHLDERHPMLFGRFDFAQTLRVVVNLIDNALKYSPGDQPIDVTARREDRLLVFEISDRGPGVPALERERIFEPFYRPPGVSPDVRGAGLGLSIGRGLAQAQSGSLTCSPRDGGGTVFTLRLPAVDVPSAQDS